MQAGAGRLTKHKVDIGSWLPMVGEVSPPSIWYTFTLPFGPESRMSGG